jgi:alpha-glucosidase
MAQINRNTGSFNEALGDYISHEISKQEIHFQLSNAEVRIIVYDHAVVRFRIDKAILDKDFSYAVISEPLDSVYEFSDHTDSCILTTELLKINIQKFPFRISAYTLDGQLLNADDSAFGTSWIGNEVTTYKQLQADERFIGLGEKTGNLDRRGKTFVNWNTDNFAYSTDADPLYLSTPFYIGIVNENPYGIFFDNSHKTTFNFGCSNDRFSYFQAENGEMNYYFIHHPTVAGIIEKYTWLTGRMELPPLWSLGFQQCRYSYYPQSEVLNVARTFREKDIPADVIYLDIHYMDEYKVFTWHPDRFPNPKAMLQELRDMGFNVVVILDPGIKKQPGYLAYDEGKEQDLFVKYPDGEEFNGQVWPGWSAFPDFTMEEARIWWGDKMKSISDAGVQGFWNDMNEPAAWGQHLPDLIEFNYDGEGATHKKARNVYGMQMARSTNEGAKKLLDGNRPFVLTRAGYSGIQRYAAVWTGDNVSSDEHMLAGVRLINSMGLTGIAYAGYDVGGFAGESSPDLYARWIALGAFSPFFRAHSMINSRDAEPWAFGEEVEDIARNYIKLRYRLMPYLYSVFYEATQNGMPVSRSLSINYTNDPKIYLETYQNQYLFGPSILVIPVSSKQSLHKAYFPEGDWYNLFTDEIQVGNKEVIIEAHKEKLPLYVKAGSVLLMEASKDSLLKSAPAETLEVHIYPGPDSTFVHYEDDGQTFDYTHGAWSTRNFQIEKNTLKISALQGGYKSATRYWKLYLHGIVGQVAQLKKDGISIPMLTENYVHLEPISDFDPFIKPNEHPLKISNLPYALMEATTNEVIISW